MPTQAPQNLTTVYTNNGSPLQTDSTGAFYDTQGNQLLGAGSVLLKDETGSSFLADAQGNMYTPSGSQSGVVSGLRQGGNAYTANAYNAYLGQKNAGTTGTTGANPDASSYLGNSSGYTSVNGGSTLGSLSTSVAGPASAPTYASPPAPPTYTPPTSLGSSNLASTSTTNYQTPSSQSTSTPLTGSYNPALPPNATPGEMQMSDLTKQLYDLNNQEAGKSQYQTQQNTAAGVDTAQNTVNSLTAQRQQILNEASQIKLQQQQGQGVTTAIDTRQRDFALAQNATAELSISSLMAAAQGDLANAQTLANKAVAAKFDPIEAQITASTKNLDLIKNDPATTLAEQNRADAAKAQLTQQAAQVAQAKADATAIQSVAIKAAADGANAVTLQNIQSATTPQQALQIAAMAGNTQKVATGTSSPATMGTAATNTAPTAGVNAGKTPVTLGNGQVAYVDNQGNFFDAKGAPISNSTVSNATAGSATNVSTTPKTTAAAKPIVDAGLTISIADIGAGAQKLDSARGPDGYTDPNLYVKMSQLWTSEGGTIAGFVKQYPPKSYINPANTTVPSWASTAPKTSSTSSSSSDLLF